MLPGSLEGFGSSSTGAMMMRAVKKLLDELESAIPPVHPA
jgi:hypothetical protein